MKSSKLAKLGVLVLSLSALVGCGGGKPTTSGKKSSTHKHTWEVVEAESVDSTCKEEGKKVEKCSGCGEKRETKVSKKAHTWQTIEAESTAPTCTEAGSTKKKCSVCGEETTDSVEALGHEWGETVWTTAPTCEGAGVGERECSRCHAKDPVTSDPLGHDIQLIGDDTEPEPGKAKVRVYSCANGCNTTYLGFKANEVTEASKSHLTIGEDGGASFWGRPIGNAVELDPTTGSASEDSHVAVFDRTVEGDFFEYKFDLTATQAASLANCKLYCDAKPSNYMGQNGVDFWRVKGDAASDWTYGMYIDMDPAHLNEDGTGKVIEDFRYVLYVDGDLQTMDSTIDTPVPQGDPRGEYVLPFTFHLHEGENTIKLVMAGGYRSTFYNFTFRAA